MNCCVKFYCRFENKKNIVYHSLAYKRRQSSVSYFIKYENSFGSILVFITCNGKEYAIVNHHALMNPFSDYFISSSYHNILSKPVDSFFFIVGKMPDRFDVIDVHSFIEMCVIVEEEHHFVVSPISAYHEHD